MINLIQNILGFIFNEKDFAIYSGNKEVLQGISVLSYSVLDDSKIMEHPLEDGSVVADHQVFNPREISCQVAFPNKGIMLLNTDIWSVITGEAVSFEDTYSELTYLYKNSVPLSIKTHANQYTNMYITSIPSDVSPETIDRQIFTIQFKEAQTVSPVYVKILSSVCKNKSSASFVSSGEVLGKTSAESGGSSTVKKSLLKEWLS